MEAGSAPAGRPERIGARVPARCPRAAVCSLHALLCGAGTLNSEYFWWLAVLVLVAAGGVVAVIGWRDRGGLDALGDTSAEETDEAGSRWDGDSLVAQRSITPPTPTPSRPDPGPEVDAAATR